MVCAQGKAKCEVNGAGERGRILLVLPLQNCKTRANASNQAGVSQFATQTSSRCAKNEQQKSAAEMSVNSTHCLETECVCLVIAPRIGPLYAEVKQQTRTQVAG